MISYDDIKVKNSDYNTYISGKDNKYAFFELSRYSAIKHLSGKNVICVAYYLTDPFNRIRNYSHISFHSDLKNFFKTDDKEWSEIYHMLFKPVKDEDEAVKIIKDIKNKHTFIP